MCDITVNVLKALRLQPHNVVDAISGRPENLLILACKTIYPPRFSELDE